MNREKNMTGSLSAVNMLEKVMHDTADPKKAVVANQALGRRLFFGIRAPLPSYIKNFSQLTSPLLPGLQYELGSHSK
jgi:hypothetical protein